MSEAINQLDFYAKMLSKLKGCVFPMQVVWQLPCPDGWMNVRVVEFRDTQYQDPYGINFYGEKRALNQAFYFYVTDRPNGDVHKDRWMITINHWDQGVAGPGWLMDAPARYRSGTPSSTDSVMLQLVTSLIDYARECLGYDDSEERLTVAKFLDSLANPKHRPLRVKRKPCDCNFCERQLSVISDRID
jgi:hypothetical protein